jgi:hypothetical protein
VSDALVNNLLSAHTSVTLWRKIFLLTKEFNFSPECHGVWGSNSEQPSRDENEPLVPARLGWAVIHGKIMVRTVLIC